MNKKIIQKIILLNISILFSILLCEGILRLMPSINNSRIASKQFKSQIVWLDENTRGFKRNLNQEFEEAYRPEGEKYFKRSQPRLFRTDENGYILGSKINENKFASFKILFSGGSTVECQEIDEPLRFPYAVQSILNERGLSEIETFNLGVRGHTTFETLKLMTGTNLYDGFQAIVFMHNINDWTLLANCGTYFISSNDKQYGSLKIQIDKFINTIRELLIDQSSFCYLLNNLRLKYFSSDIIPQSEEQVVIDDEKISQILETYHKNILNLAALAKVKNSIPIFITEPSPVKGGLQDDLNNELRKICKTNRYHLIDVASEFPEESEDNFFPDRVHLNNSGSLLIATIIAEKLPYVLESTLSDLSIQKQSLTNFKNMLNGNICEIEIPYNARYPVFTKDMSKLYFQAIFNEKSHICCIDLPAGKFKRLSPFQHSFWHPCPLGDDTVYAVSNCLEGEKLFKLTSQNLELLPVFDSKNFNGAIPAISNGDEICFPGFRENEHPDLFIFSLTNNQLKQITKTDYEEWRPVFHPNGRQIFYISKKKGNFDIFSYDLLNKQEQYIIGTEGDDWDVDISPDGNFLVFAARQKNNFNLMLYNLNKEILSQLTDADGNEWDPRFSPNGKVIVYSEEKDNKSTIKFIKVPSL